jgi:hypothetical protein
VLGLDHQGEHVLIRAGEFTGDEFSIMCMALVNVVVVDTDDKVRAADGGDWRLIEIAHAEDQQPRYGFLQVEPVEWIAAEEVAVADGGEWQRVAAEQGEAYLRRLIGGGGES